MNEKKKPDEGVVQDLAKMQDLAGAEPQGGQLVDPAFGGAEFVEADDSVPMDRVHADSLAGEGMLRARMLGEKVRGLGPRKDPYLVDVLSGRRQMSELPAEHPFWQRHNRDAVLAAEQRFPHDVRKKLDAEPLNQEEVEIVFGPMAGAKLLDQVSEDALKGGTGAFMVLDDPQADVRYVAPGEMKYQGLDLLANPTMDGRIGGIHPGREPHTWHPRVDFSPEEKKAIFSDLDAMQDRIRRGMDIRGADDYLGNSDDLIEHLKDRYRYTSRRAVLGQTHDEFDRQFFYSPPETSRWVRFKTWLRLLLPW